MELICPNKNLQEWQELKAAIPDMAYVIWNLNKGEGIDRAPNGAPSILFQSLLDELGDRTAAIHAKANVYRQSFFRWFGDWINHPESASKMVDENGEPLVMYHGTTEVFDAFANEFKGSTDPGDWGLGFYFSPKKSVAEDCGDIILPVYLNIKNPVPDYKLNIARDFGRPKLKSLSLREDIQHKIDVLEYTVKDYEFKLYGDDPDYQNYKDPNSLAHKVTQIRLEDSRNKLKQLQDRIKTESEDILNSDINQQYNDKIDDLNQYDGVLPKPDTPLKDKYEVVVKNPNQIKSVYNSGAFATDDNRIRYSLPLQDVSDVDLDDVHSSTYLERFRDFLDRLNITVEDSTTEQNILDLSRKIVYLADTDARSLALLQARIAYQLLDQDTRNKLDNQFLHSRNNERYVKRKGIGRYSLVENERIINDIADAILGRQNEISKDKSLWQKIKNILFDLLSKIIKHRAIYQNTVERIAQEVTNRYSPYFNLMINENTEIKQLNVDLLKSSEHYPVYQAMINSGASLAGSAGIRLQGTLYRKGEETFHDLDFTKNYDSFSWKVRVYNRELWQDYYKYIREEYNIPDSVQRIDSKKVPKRIRKDAYRYAKQIMLGKVREAFKNTNMYRQLSNTYKVIDIKNTFISNTTGMCVTYTVDGFPVDIFYTDYHDMYNINGVVIDDFSVAFKAKLIMRRDKDMRDIINFKSYAIQKYNESIANTSVPYQSKPQITVNVQEIEQVDDKLQNIINFLQKRFPQLVLQWIDAEQIPNGVRKDANAFVKNGVVYLVRGRVTAESTIEEFLHPFLEALQQDNPTQFNILVAEAKLHYPKLWRQIQATYTDKNGFSENDREHELLAHALSEAVNNRFENEQNQSTFKRLLNGFLAWLNSILYKYTGKNIILNKTKLGELVDDIFNQDKELRVNVDSNTTRYNISEETTKMLENARKGVQQRLRSLKHYSNPNIRQIQQMEKLIDDLNKLDALEGSQELLEYITRSLPVAAEFLDKSLSDISAKQLVQMRRDYLSFFIPVLEDLQYLIDTTDEFKNLPDYDNFANTVQDTLTLSRSIVNKFNNIIKAKCRQMLLEYGEAAGSPTIKQLVDELDKPESDLNWLETFLGLNSSAGNETVRIMADMLMNSINKTKRETFQDGRTLVDLLQQAVKAYPGLDVQKLLQEVDENGQTTGFFTRRLNWGRFFRDQQAYIEQLVKEMGIPVDENHELQFKDNEQKREFIKRRTYWQLEHGVLKYTKQYYDAKFEMSIEAQEALDEVNDAIQQIRDRATVRNHFLAHLLTDEERATLKSLLKQKAALSSEYNYDGTKKEGTELRIAQEIDRFRQKVGEYVDYDTDQARFKADAAYVMRKYGFPSKEYDAWLLNSTEEAYSEEFYERLAELTGARSGATALYKKRARLLAPYKNTNNKEDMDDIPYEVRQQIKEIDETLATLRYKMSKEEYEEFMELAEIKYTDKYYEDADKAREEGRYNEWYMENHYQTEDGHWRPASYYTYLVPRDTRYIVRVPNYFYKRVSSTSPWVNPNFQEGEGYVQPNPKEYDNSKAWNEIESRPEVKALYDALVEAMEESNRRISFFETMRKGKLPQISGRFMTIMSRADNKFEALKYYVKDTFSVKDDDTDYVEDFEYRNDGSPIKLIPTRFIRMLDDPSKITSDVVGSVIQYIEMSRNYQNMSAIQSELELLMYRLENITIATKHGTKTGKNTNIYKKAESLLDMVLYGKRSEKLIIRGVDVTKALNKLYNYISLSNLAYNIWAITTNYVTGQGTLDIESIAGKYFNTKDIAFAKKEFLHHFGTLTANIGNVNHKDKVSLLMQFLQVTRNNQETFDRLDQSRVLRGLNQHFWYNGYTAGDFVIKGQLLIAVLHSYKLVNGEYMTEEQYVATQDDKNAARKHFQALQDTLYDPVDVVDGQLQIVAQNANKQAVEKALNRAQNKIQILAGRIDGNITDVDRAIIHQGVLTRFLTMHRNFIIVGLHERFKSKQFNYATGQMEGGMYSDALRYTGNVFKCVGQLFSGKNIHFLTNVLSQYEQLDEVEKYNVRRTYLDLLNIAIWTAAIAPFFVFMASEGDDDNWALQAMAYLSMRATFEFRSLYNPLELTNLLNSPSAAVSTLGILFNFIKLIFPSTYTSDNGLFRELESGAYEGWPKILRNIIKLTPAKNVFEMFSAEGIRNKRTYLDNQLMF